MAIKFEEIENYVTTKWYNYNPPSIDQDNLRHIEDNIKLNRDTINEIIRRLGVVPTGGTSSENQQIYDTSIYDTLIDFKDKIKALQSDKLDKATYEQERGDMSTLLGGGTLVGAINNRLRKDTDDVSQFSYTFKALTLTNTLSVGTTSTFNGAITAKSTITSAGIVKANGGLETTTLKASGNANITGTLGVTGKTTLNNGLIVKNGGNLTGTLTVDNLIVNGNISCTGAISASGNMSCYELTANRQVTVNCADNGNLWVKKNYIELGGSAEHRLWVQGANTSLRNGDALIRTVG